MMGAEHCVLNTGKTMPISGWKSNVYGEKSPISTIEATYDGQLPHEFCTYVSWGECTVLQSECSNRIIEKFRDIVSES